MRNRPMNEAQPPRIDFYHPVQRKARHIADLSVDTQIAELHREAIQHLATDVLE
mgnify:FL=1